MGKLSKFEVTYTDNTLVYTPGQMVTGVLTLENRETLSCRGVRVNFKGKAHVHWSEGSGNNRRSYGAKEVYFSQDVLLFGMLPSQGRDNEDLAAGTHTYPFSFQLPVGVPASFEHPVGRVRYRVQGIVDVLWQFDIKTKTPITVTKALDLNLWPDMMSEARGSNQKQLCCLCCASGSISGMLHVRPRKGYVSGEKLTVHAEIENHTRRRMKQSFIALVQGLSFHATSKTRTDNREIPGTRLTHPAIQPGGSDQWNGEQLVIPPDLPPSFLDGCKIIDIHYFVQLNVDPAGPAFDLKVPVEIMIGSVPLRQAGDRATVVGPEAVTPADFTQWATSSFPSSAGGATVPAPATYSETAFGKAWTTGGGEEDNKYSTANSYSQW